MSAGAVVELAGLTKRFGDVVAVDDLTFRIEPGRVTGFLGPNGAGKTTTLRMVVGLVRPDSGTATIGGLPFVHLPDPPRMVGAAIESSGFHPGRTARRHLEIVAIESGIGTGRAAEVLDQVGLADAAERRVGGYSQGMRQRLALATALLGQPQVLLLDEPANGLDPEGIAWLRSFLRWYAREGRTVLVSSHQLAEVAQSADDVVIIDRGRLLRHQSIPELLAASGPRVRVGSPDAARLAEALAEDGWPVTRPEAGVLLVDGAEPAAVGAVAARVGAELHLLVGESPALEQVFLDLVADETSPGGVL